MVTADLREAEPARGVVDARALAVGARGRPVSFYLFGGMVVRFVCDPCARMCARVSRVCPGSVRETRDLTTRRRPALQRRGHPVTLRLPRPRARSPPPSTARCEHSVSTTTHDSTRYGLSRSSPRTIARLNVRLSRQPSFCRIQLPAPAMSFKLTMGMSPF